MDPATVIVDSRNITVWGGRPQRFHFLLEHFALAVLHIVLD